jgi:hypothetical protein
MQLNKKNNKLISIRWWAITIFCSVAFVITATASVVFADTEPCTNSSWKQMGNSVSDQKLSRGICLSESTNTLPKPTYQFFMFRGYVSKPISGELDAEQLMQLDDLLERRISELGLTAINDISLQGTAGIQLFRKFMNTVNSKVSTESNIYSESELKLIETMLQLTMIWNEVKGSSSARYLQIGSVISEATHQVISYHLSHDNVVYNLSVLSHSSVYTKISEMNFNKKQTNPKAYELKMPTNISKMKMTHSLIDASSTAYKWCWKNNIKLDDLKPAFVGLYGLLFGVIPTMVMCGTLPSVPFVLGVTLSPLDFIFGSADQTISNRFDRRANRAFKQMMKGERVMVGEQTFAVLLEKIKGLQQQ